MAQAVTTFCIGTFFGAAAYISLVQHPATIATGAGFGKRFFPPMYSRAAVMQGALAAIGAAAAIVTFVTTGGILWLLVALLIGSVIPFTVVVIAPVTNQLNSLPPELPDDQAMAILAQWGRLHWVRTMASGLAFLVCLYCTYVKTIGLP